MVNFVRLDSLWVESRDLRLSKGPIALQLQHHPSSLSVCPHLPLCTSTTFRHSHSQFQELVSQRATCLTFLSPSGVCRNVTLASLLIPKPFHITCLWCPPLIAFHFCFCFCFFFTHHIYLHLTCCREFKRHQGKPCFYLLLCPQSLNTATYTVK